MKIKKVFPKTFAENELMQWRKNILPKIRQNIILSAFIHAIVGSSAPNTYEKLYILEQHIPTENIDNKTLVAFLSQNPHIATFLRDRLPDLNQACYIWNRHHSKGKLPTIRFFNPSEKENKPPIISERVYSSFTIKPHYVM